MNENESGMTDLPETYTVVVADTTYKVETAKWSNELMAEFVAQGIKIKLQRVLPGKGNTESARAAYRTKLVEAWNKGENGLERAKGVVAAKVSAAEAKAAAAEAKMAALLDALAKAGLDVSALGLPD